MLFADNLDILTQVNPIHDLALNNQLNNGTQVQLQEGGLPLVLEVAQLFMMMSTVLVVKQDLQTASLFPLIIVFIMKMQEWNVNHHPPWVCKLSNKCSVTITFIPFVLL